MKIIIIVILKDLNNIILVLRKMTKLENQIGLVNLK